jgi:hypothetical protein
MKPYVIPAIVYRRSNPSSVTLSVYHNQAWVGFVQHVYKKAGPMRPAHYRYSVFIAKGEVRFESLNMRAAKARIAAILEAN